MSRRRFEPFSLWRRWIFSGVCLCSVKLHPHIKKRQKWTEVQLTANSVRESTGWGVKAQGPFKSTVKAWVHLCSVFSDSVFNSIKHWHLKTLSFYFWSVFLSHNQATINSIHLKGIKNPFFALNSHAMAQKTTKIVCVQMFVAECLMV